MTTAAPVRQMIPARELRDSVGVMRMDIVERNTPAIGEGRMLVRGVVQRANVVNGNNRRYSRSLWERVLRDPRIVESLRTKSMYGVVEHPSDGQTRLLEASHIMTRLWLEGDVVYGEALVLATPAGKIMQEIIRASGHAGISSRGRGSSAIDDSGVEDVNESDFTLLTFDFVADPSTPGADMAVSESARRQLTESVRRVLDGPFGSKGTLVMKNVELSRVRVRAHDFLAEAAGANAQRLQAMAAQLTEDRAVAVGMNAGENAAYASEVLTAIDEAAAAVDRRLVESFRQPAAAAAAGAIDESARGQIDFWRTRCERLEAAAQTGAQKTETTQLRDLNTRLTEAHRARGARIQVLEAANRAMAARLEAATRLVDAVLEAHATTAVRKAVTKVVTDNPVLESVTTDLLECQTPAQVVAEAARFLRLAQAGSPISPEESRLYLPEATTVVPPAKRVEKPAPSGHLSETRQRHIRALTSGAAPAAGDGGARKASDTRTTSVPVSECVDITRRLIARNKRK